MGAALMLPMVTACNAEEPRSTGSTEAGAATGAAGAGGAGESKKQKSIDMRRREENLIAACMKKSGFTYIPYVPASMLNPPAPKPTDYASLKTFRSKYGFGNLYAPYVYPGDPNLAQPTENDPNDAIVDGLDPNQQYNAYREALDGNWNDKSGQLELIGGCVAEAVKAVDPMAWRRAVYRHNNLSGKRLDENSREFKELCEASPACKNSDADDARLKPLQNAYVACLKRNGYPADEYDTDTAASDTLLARFDRLDTDPDVFTTKIDPAAARAELKNEIKVALEDLECGKDYIATKAEIEARNDALKPPSGGLP